MSRQSRPVHDRSIAAGIVLLEPIATRGFLRYPVPLFDESNLFTHSSGVYSVGFCCVFVAAPVGKNSHDPTTAEKLKPAQSVPSLHTSAHLSSVFPAAGTPVYSTLTVPPPNKFLFSNGFEKKSYPGRPTSTGGTGSVDFRMIALSLWAVVLVSEMKGRDDTTVGVFVSFEKS